MYISCVLTDSQFKYKKNRYIHWNILNIVVYRKYLSVIENSIRLGVFTGNVTERIRYTLDII